MRREIFRYSTENEDYIGFADDCTSDFINISVPVLKNVEDPVWWIDIKRTNRCAKKRKGYGKSKSSAIYEGGSGDLRTLIEIKKRVESWLEKFSPKFLSIGAYRDSVFHKRYLFYHKVLTKCGYRLCYTDYDDWSIPVFLYAREGMNIRYPNVKFTIEEDEL